MKKLTKSAFNRAKDFLASGARKLEWHLFEFQFGNSGGANEEVVEELKKYQNLDGGFGRALEPDVRMEDSSVVATKFALQILIDIQAPVQERLVQDGIAYLLETFDRERGVWPLVTNKVMNAPHAPWWDFEGLEEEFGSFSINPKAGILRCLLEYQELVPQDLIDRVTETLMEHFERLPIKMSLFDAVSLLLLLQANRLGDEHKERLLVKLEKAGAAIVSSNPNEWHNFAVKPLWLAPSPSAPLAYVLDKDIQANLEFEIENQNLDGSWSPSWSWNKSYPESWKRAEKEWKGVLTLAMLRSLRDYARIDGYSPRLSGYKYHID